MSDLIEPTTEDVALLRHTNNVAKRAVELGRHPFGAILVGPDGSRLLTQCNIDTVNHAESTLARTAATNYSSQYLWDCTLYTSVEPCCMCSGTIYWANIGKVVYGVSEQDLLDLTGNSTENPTMSLDCRTVLKSGQKDVQVVGPVQQVRTEILQVHKSYW